MHAAAGPLWDQIKKHIEDFFFKDVAPSYYADSQGNEKEEYDGVVKTALAIVDEYVANKDDGALKKAIEAFVPRVQALFRERSVANVSCQNVAQTLSCIFKPVSVEDFSSLVKDIQITLRNHYAEGPVDVEEDEAASVEETEDYE